MQVHRAPLAASALLNPPAPGLLAKIGRELVREGLAQHRVVLVEPLVPKDDDRKIALLRPSRRRRQGRERQLQHLAGSEEVAQAEMGREVLRDVLTALANADGLRDDRKVVADLLKRILVADDLPLKLLRLGLET